MTKLLTLACITGASLALGSSWPLVAEAQSARPQVTVSPSSVVPTAQYFATTQKLAGSGVIVTVKVGPNKVLIPAFPVEVMECDPNPSSQSDCDMETTLPYDQLTKRRDVPAANGSVTFHFLLWAPLPNTWDPGSVIKVGPGHPTALWIGDDPSNWAGSGLVSAPVQVVNKAAKPGKGPLKPGNGARDASTVLSNKNDSSSHGLSAMTVALVAVVGVVVLAAGVAGGIAVSGGRRRHRPVRS
jgi:hypothetical protein